MTSALLYGLAASSALVIGAAIGTRFTPSKHITSILLAFASGALIAALAFELFEEAFELGGAVRSGLGLLAGAAVFVAVDTLLDRRIAGESGLDGQQAVAQGARGGVGWALLAAVTLDGVPENLALGVSLVEGASVSLLVAIFASNLPEALVGAVAMRGEGRGAHRDGDLDRLRRGALARRRLRPRGGRRAGRFDPRGRARVAGGAVLASRADTLMPEAY